MKTLMQIFNRRISGDNVDGEFGRWSCIGGAVGVFILATVFFVRQAQDPFQLAGGLALALVTCLALVCTGIATSRLHWAMLKHKVPVRARLAEFAGYPATIAILMAGVLLLPSLAMDRVCMTMALLLILAASMIPTLLGIGSTLRFVARQQAAVQS